MHYIKVLLENKIIEQVSVSRWREFIWVIYLKFVMSSYGETMSNWTVWSAAKATCVMR